MNVVDDRKREMRDDRPWDGGVNTFLDVPERQDGDAGVILVHGRYGAQGVGICLMV